MKNDNEILLLCDCSSAEHQLIVSWDNDDNEVYVRVHLANCYGFWRRLWHAVKYVFGHKSRYGAFDEVILRKEDADNLQKVVDHLRACGEDAKPPVNYECWGSCKSTTGRRLNASSSAVSSYSAIF
jgi:hypothetical protein